MSLLRTLGLATIAGSITAHHFLTRTEEKHLKRKYNKGVNLGWVPPTRETTLARCTNKVYDMVIVGGGSVGGGCALDAASRGYSVLVLEKEDFSSGTSSKSTKLIHGGIRYLEKAIKELDYKQLSLVVEGLRERKSFLSTAPYLTNEVGILLPIKCRYLVPYFWLGTKVYDWLSGGYGIQKSFFIGKQAIKSVFPAINTTKLAGGMIYFDGQMNDSRMNAMLVETSVYHGADALNYAEVTNIVKNNGKITGVSFSDKETGKTFTVHSRGVVNATGAYSDTIRTIDTPGTKKIIAPSIGAHLVMDSGYTGKFGLLNPSTKNGSVLFVLPWNGISIAGSTDTATSTIDGPVATKKDVRYIIEEMAEFIDRSIKPKAANILSAWAGVRPLAMDPAASTGNSQALVRSHLIETSSSGLVTIAGGKWTSFREMAEEAVTHSARVFGLAERMCVTKWIKLIGSHGYSKTLPMALSRKFGVPGDVASHLASAYGDRAWKVCMHAGGNHQRIHPAHPYLMAEVSYTIENEHVRKVSDFLGRRTRFAFMDVRGAHSSIGPLVQEFAAHMKWTPMRMEEEKKEALAYADTMGYSLLRNMEKDEQKFNGFSRELKNLCSSPNECNTQKATNLVSKYFGSKGKHAFGSFARGRNTLPASEILGSILPVASILN
ncbi:glycerol-3-phosphate dehydrogenase [Nematocida displodere]|uniref:glycerol-3-phosphate dehydrogenase n=1 Tax=Nematocida displodere TaxID=1805483 RepID=A0A177EBH1_9MICR|nr:glycerol-3-phosphate dehydrogenase [Nematocida displodere]